MASSHRLGKRIGGAVALAAFLAFLVARPGLAGEPELEAARAAQHAGFAAEAANLGMVHAHLQHAINCLVGPDSEAFDKAQANPCKGLGKGAIPDALDDVARHRYELALERAKAGLVALGLEDAKRNAAAVARILREED